MTVADTLITRNTAFAQGFTPGLRMMPALRTIVIGCVDPRVDPEKVLGLQTGEAAVIRNVGGRVTPGVVEELTILRGVTQAAGGDLGAGWELVVLHHTDCGITRVAEQTELLATYFGLAGGDVAHEVDSKQIADPHRAVAVDLVALSAAAETHLGPGIVVSGLVYDVATGLVEPVATPPRATVASDSAARSGQSASSPATSADS